VPLSVDVDCINKDDRYDPDERIRHIGGPNGDGTRWRLTVEQAITGIQQGQWEFWVNVAAGRVRVIIAKSARGNLYLKTEADATGANNLLRLPECR
jgi:hypothetical protein